MNRRVAFVCLLFVSYLFRVGHSTDMCSLLQENRLRRAFDSAGWPALGMFQLRAGVI